MTLRFDSSGVCYDISVGSGLLAQAGRLFDLERKVLVITDEGVPEEYAATVLRQCREPYLLVLPQGEGSKSIATLERIFDELLRAGFTRKDAIVAVGGGVVGDVSGFAAACWQRGIDYYNVPTTLLSQVDSSVGGKTAVNFHGIKNIVGAFHHPSGVIADTSVLETLSPRLFAEGMAEVIKMAATLDASLFELLESTDDVHPLLPEVIYRALKLKLDVVTQDPSEKGLRAVLNFGHTIGHAVEAAGALRPEGGHGRSHPRLRKREGPFREGSRSDAMAPLQPKGAGYFHGEGVAIGMTYTSEGEARERIEKLLLKYGLPVSDPFDPQDLMRLALKDKKRGEAGTKIVWVDAIGSYSFRNLDDTQLFTLINNRKNEK